MKLPDCNDLLLQFFHLNSLKDFIYRDFYRGTSQPEAITTNVSISVKN